MFDFLKLLVYKKTTIFKSKIYTFFLATIAIGSAFACVAILDQLKEINLLSDQVHEGLYSIALEMSKMLFGLEKALS